MATRAQARTYIRSNLLDEVNAGRWTDTMVNDAINRAQREVHRRIVELDETAFRNQTSFSLAASAASVDLTGASALNATFSTIVQMLRTESSGAPSDTNPGTEVLKVGWKELPVYSPTTPTIIYRSITYPYVYALQGNHLYVRPIPSETLFLTITWEAADADIADGAGSDGTNLLGGLYTEFHEAVELRAAARLSAKKKDASLRAQLDADYRNVDERMVAYFGNRATQYPRMVRFVPDP